MHIGIVAPCSSGLLADLLPDSGEVDLGCGGYLIATLVRALINRGHHVSVVTLSTDIDRPVVLKGPRLTFYVSSMRTRKRMRDFYKVERRGLREGINLACPDVLHAHWTYEFALACMETRLPTVVTVHDNAFEVLRYSSDLYRLGRLLIQIRVLRKARWLTAVSPYLVDSLGWLAIQKLEVVPNPVEVFQADGDFGSISSHPVRIATVLDGWGRLKNPKAAIKAFALLRHHIPDSELYMFGNDFEKGGTAQRWAINGGIAGNIYFCGHVPHSQLRARLRHMSLLLHPALEESFGMVLVESMGVGLPVVAGRLSGGVPWVLDDGRAGFLTDVTSPYAIAQTLLLCIQNETECREKRLNAYRRAASVFSPNAVAALYEKVYEQALPSQR